jgi:serine/threonine protein kinase
VRPHGLDFTSTDRFSIRRRIGAGGMGVVYEAFDRVREQVVAL